MYNVTCTIHVFIAIVMPLNTLNQSHALTVPDMLFITISLTLLCRVSGREDRRILGDERKKMHVMIRPWHDKIGSSILIQRRSDSSRTAPCEERKDISSPGVIDGTLRNSSFITCTSKVYEGDTVNVLDIFIG
jgi:hypothetical protein